MLSPAGHQPEVPCVRCHERVAGLAWGDRCPRCLSLRRTRAKSIARRISLLTALLTAILLGWTTTPGPNQRMWIGIGTLASFFFVRLIALRVAMEFLPD
ncbi:MAG: hypothetical protein H6R40_790 [Gemmatimonadetes bacterium]|nr:hypothetical protein [Gemmatimonadota bacterium]